MDAIFYLGIFRTIYGILGLFGIQHIAKRYRGKPWTKKYIRSQGVSWLLLGIPWLIFYLACHNAAWKTYQMAGIIALLGLPAVVFSAITKRKYKKRLEGF